MIFFDKFISRICGIPDSTPLEHRIFNSLALGGCLCGIFSTLINALLDLNVILTLSTASISIIFCIFYYLSRIKKYFERLVSPFLVIVYSIAAGIWFLNGGIDGPIPSIFFLLFLVSITISKQKSHLFHIVSILVLFSVLFTIEYMYPDLVVGYKTPSIRFFDVYLTIGIFLIIAAINIKTLKKNYDQEKELTTKKNRALQLEILKRKEIEEKILIAKKQAESANNAKSEFLANISHDLRTPLQGIIGFSVLGRSTNASLSQEKAFEYFDSISVSGKRLLSLIDDLLDLSKLESGKTDYNFENKSINPLIDAALLELSPIVQEKNITIRFENSTTEYFATIDEGKITQVLNNLFSNAIKFSSVKSHIKIEILNQQDNILISIIDGGRGITEEEHQTIFEKFTQSKNNKKGEKGTGLGLPICKKIIIDHGGDIWVENNPAGGAIFKFTLKK